MKKMLFTNNWLYQYVLLIILLLSGLVTVGYAASVPNVFTSGTVAKSSEVNENFNYLADRSWELNGNEIYYNKGNIGIGTTAPGTTLDVNGRINTFDETAQVIFSNKYCNWNWNSDLVINAHQADAEDYTNIVFQIKDIEKMRIDGATGNVGIGTMNPQRNLHIDGGQASYIRMDDDDGDDWTIGAEGKGFIFYSYSDSEYRMIIDNNGNVGIGTTSPYYTLDVNGTIRGNNVSPSDVRLKENIRTIDSALDKVTHLRGVYFNWKASGEENPQDMGLIAQEVETTFPEVVSEDQEGYKSISYGKLVGALVEAVKELKDQNEQLKKQNESLSARIAVLERKL